MCGHHVVGSQLFYSDAYLEEHPDREDHLLVKKLRQVTTLQVGPLVWSSLQVVVSPL